MKLKIHGFEIEQIKRSSRKSIGLAVNDKAQVIVMAPYSVPIKEIEQVIKAHAPWLNRHLQKMRERLSESTAGTLYFGSKIWYFGKKITLKPAEAGEDSLYFDEDLFLAKRLLPYAGELLFYWYRDILIDVIEELIEPYIRQYRFPVRQYKISHAEKRWGSCSTSGNINFSYRLAMVPPKMIEYVVVHELVHLWHPDHSPAFWQGVKKILPDYKQRQVQLKKEGYRYRLQR